MSNLQRKTNACFGIEAWLRKINMSTSEKNVADVTASFLKSKNLPYKKHNPRYKGLFTASICNAEKVQENFEEFKTFVKNNYFAKHIEI